MIKQFDRQTLRAVTTAIETSLTNLAKTHGIVIKYKGGNFTPDNAVIKLELAIQSADGTAVSRERSTWTQLATFYGLKPEWLDKTFNFYGKTFKIVGLNPKARTAPVIAANSNGKLFKFRQDDVQTAMGGKPEAPKSREFTGTRNADTLATIIIGRRNPNHAEIERRLAEMRNNNPEGYYADGELKASGATEKQIHDMHYRSIAREFQPGYKPLFASIPVPPAPPIE